mmetsp:Transcript_21171/g.59586  ORF Transcript_21171/g.59586 Transcript_21171/m.59586 type:complete len:294 (+) Transcript_21171:260-1141(+)|eukprot:CAMPEP_0119128608 /NCGR_PEP_ID=MMETSP1310-20130426/6687_1 /TAXON_ID=464262 /ORGANISM="Genus nov. species nov., Strain RCC2339" /LENGTH=293 /DNA_ID=CAMNT_0007118957 /DNA_START=169 /DNA_END=1050 /DNA_ORIENTATION=-
MEWVRSSYEGHVTKNGPGGAALAAVLVGTEAIERSTASTMMEMKEDMTTVLQELRGMPGTPLSLRSSLAILERLIARAELDSPVFDECKAAMVETGRNLARVIEQSARKVAQLADRLVQDGMTILVHGSTEPAEALIRGPARSKRICVVVTESRPNGAGEEMLRMFQEAGVPAKMVPDAAVAHHMGTVDLVLVGSEAVVESGGVVNAVGTYQIALLAKQLKKPFYACTERCKFMRVFPLQQQDVVRICYPPGCPEPTHPIDYTPPSLIQLLITDLGLLTPSAVSEELIKLYQG